MQKKGNRLASIAALLVWSVIGLAATDAEAQRATGYHRALSFATDGEAQARALEGLFLFESGPEGYVERVFVTDPKGHRWILTGTVLPTTGLKTLRWTDDASGLWVELRYDLGFTTPDLETYFERAYDLLGEGSGNRVAITLVTSAAEGSASHSVPTGEKKEVRSFLEALAEAEQAEQLATSVPSPFYDATSFLDSALDDLQGVGYSLLPVIRVVEGLKEMHAAQGEAGSHAWRQQVGKPRVGLEVEDPDLRRFLDGFESIDPRAPLADHRLVSVATAAAER